MDCRNFRDALPAYLAGEIGEPRFGDLVEHEARCAECHRFASESVLPAAPVDLEPGNLERDPAANSRSGSGAALGNRAEGALPRLSSQRRLARTQAILERTQGDDCRFVQLRLAEALDEELDETTHRTVRTHVKECAACKSMRDLLQELPLFYEALPQLKPSRAFTAAVLDRTLGPRPTFWQTLRALWKKPEAIWEATAACALLAALTLTGVLPSYDTVANRVQGAAHAGIDGVETRIERDALGSENKLVRTAVEVYNAGSQTWTRLEGWADGTKTWAARVANDIETGNAANLFEDAQVLLRPLGLGAGDSDEHEPDEPDEPGEPDEPADTGEPASPQDSRAPASGVPPANQAHQDTLDLDSHPIPAFERDSERPQSTDGDGPKPSEGEVR